MNNTLRVFIYIFIVYCMYEYTCDIIISVVQFKEKTEQKNMRDKNFKAYTQ